MCLKLSLASTGYGDMAITHIGILMAAAVLQLRFFVPDFGDTSIQNFTHYMYQLAVDNIEEIFWVSAPKN